MLPGKCLGLAILFCCFLKPSLCKAVQSEILFIHNPRHDTILWTSWAVRWIAMTLDVLSMMPSLSATGPRRARVPGYPAVNESHLLAGFWKFWQYASGYRAFMNGLFKLQRIPSLTSCHESENDSRQQAARPQLTYFRISVSDVYHPNVAPTPAARVIPSLFRRFSTGVPCLL